MEFTKRELDLLYEALQNWLNDLTRHESVLTFELYALATRPRNARGQMRGSAGISGLLGGAVHVDGVGQVPAYGPFLSPRTDGNSYGSLEGVFFDHVHLHARLDSK